MNQIRCSLIKTFKNPHFSLVDYHQVNFKNWNQYLHKYFFQTNCECDVNIHLMA